jgi:ribosomal protein S18 acetylase RimI-like enzyme
MIRPATPEDFPAMLALQTACIQDLEVYSQQERETWIDYLNKAGTSRYADFQSVIMTDDRSVISGFVSWAINTLDRTGTIECLYVRQDCRGRGTGQFLLAEAEMKSPANITMHVRSTLNAQTFYEAQDYEYTGSAISRAGFKIALLEKSQ